MSVCMSIWIYYPFAIWRQYRKSDFMPFGGFPLYGPHAYVSSSSSLGWVDGELPTASPSYLKC